MDLIALLVVLALGVLAGHGLRLKARTIACNRTATRWAVWALLLVMGTRLARSRALLAQAPGILVAAAGSAVCLVALYFLAFFLLGRFRPHPAPPQPEPGPPQGGDSATVPWTEAAWTEVAWNMGWIAAGFLLMLGLPPALARALPLDAAAQGVLLALLAGIGLDLGAEWHRLAFRELPLPLLLLPLVNIAFTLGCGLAFGLLRGMPWRQGLLLVSGLGWYSLSSVLIAQHGLATMALMAFIHNVFRELLAILTAPVAARLSPYLPIYLGGATSMDVMLPFVQRYSGRTYTLVAFYAGLACSLAVIPLVRILI